jgi:DNA-binding GntR family transcriptional regulator
METIETDANKKVRLDLAYHMALCKPCGRPYLLQLIKKIHDHVSRYVHLTVYLMDFKKHPKYNHKALFESYQKKKIDETTNILKNHFEIATYMISKKFESST